MSTLLGLVLASCDISAQPYAGTIARLSLDGATPLPKGQHLELWARNDNDDIVRIRGLWDAPDPKDPSKTIHLETRGLAIRLAITMDDPCMIDKQGHLLVTPDAYPNTVT